MVSSGPITGPLSLLTVEHVTTYHYRQPVRSGQHRLMFARARATTCKWSKPALMSSVPSRIDWMLDTQSNSVTLVTPPSGIGGVENRMPLQDRTASRAQRRNCLLQRTRSAGPFDYSGEERRDLGAMLEPHYLDPDGRLYEWMRPFSRKPRGPTRRNC